MRERTRPRWNEQQTSEIYASAHDWRALGEGHALRISTTIDVARAIWPNPESVADLSVGVPTVAEALGAKTVILGDFAPGYEFQGPIEETAALIPEVDVFICAETLEHLWEPDPVLELIRRKAKALVCSVPISVVPEDDGNGEHYWAFDRAGAEEMLRAAKWEPTIFVEVEAAPGTTSPTYRCGIWGCL